MKLDQPPEIAGLSLSDADLIGVAWDVLTPDFMITLRLGMRNGNGRLSLVGRRIFASI